MALEFLRDLPKWPGEEDCGEGEWCTAHHHATHPFPPKMSPKTNAAAVAPQDSAASSSQQCPNREHAEGLAEGLPTMFQRGRGGWVPAAKLVERWPMAPRSWDPWRPGRVPTPSACSACLQDLRWGILDVTEHSCAHHYPLLSRLSLLSFLCLLCFG